MPSPLKSPEAMEYGWRPEVSVGEFTQVQPGLLVPTGTVVNTPFPLEASTNETVPVRGGAVPISVIVAPRLYSPQLPLRVIVVAVAFRTGFPVTVSGELLEALVALVL